MSCTLSIPDFYACIFYSEVHFVSNLLGIKTLVSTKVIT